MADVAIGRCAFEYPVLMAERAVCRDMRAEQWEICLVMIERGGLPRVHCVACGAVVRELPGHMVRCF